MSKFIFLDIDGVVATTQSRYNLDPLLCARVQEIADLTGAKIVLSSTHRNDPKVRQKLKKMGIAHIFGVTPDFSGGKNRGRGNEIAAFVASNPCEVYVILDDDSFDIFQTDELVQTNEAVGITEMDAQDCVNILNGARRQAIMIEWC